MNWKASWHKRLISFLVWTPRRFIYWLLGIPDEIEESIMGLDWALEQNSHRIEMIEAFLNIESIEVEAEEVTELSDGTFILHDAKIIEGKEETTH